jgi:hypothetical protein
LSGETNPKPFSALKNFTVPDATLAPLFFAGRNHAIFLKRPQPYRLGIYSISQNLFSNLDVAEEKGSAAASGMVAP